MLFCARLTGDCCGGTEAALFNRSNLLEAAGRYVLPGTAQYCWKPGLDRPVGLLWGPGTLFWPNIRPAVEVTASPAQAHHQVYRKMRLRHISGAQDIDQWTGGKLMPTASAFGRTIRFIGNEYAKTKKGVLGIDVGAASTTIAAAFSDNLILNFHPAWSRARALPGCSTPATWTRSPVGCRQSCPMIVCGLYLQ
jgi:hypothetical protein